MITCRRWVSRVGSSRRFSILTEDDLAKVEKRRELPTRLTQRLQVIIQNNVIDRLLAADQPLKAPLLLRLSSRFAWLRRIPARIVGLGFRPEHVHTPETRTAKG